MDGLRSLRDRRRLRPKLLGAWLGGDPRFARRFRRESAMAARLTSPHIVPIHRYTGSCCGSGVPIMSAPTIATRESTAATTNAPCTPPAVATS